MVSEKMCARPGCSARPGNLNDEGLCSEHRPPVGEANTMEALKEWADQTFGGSYARAVEDSQKTAYRLGVEHGVKSAMDADTRFVESERIEHLILGFREGAMKFFSYATDGRSREEHVSEAVVEYAETLRRIV